MAKRKENIFDRLLYYPLFGLWYGLSRLPMGWHYFCSDLLFHLIYHLVRYRRKLVRKNLSDSFPGKTPDEIRRIERGFYHYFCDVFIESFKFMSISPEELKQRMVFQGIEYLHDSCQRGKSCAIYLGHYGNWEWVSSLALWIDPQVGKCVQLYHPLENPVFDRLIGYTRERMGSTNIPVEQSLRHFVKYRKEGIPVIIGFIADQVPHWRNIHYWTQFLNHPKTPVFSGSERMTRQFDMDAYFLKMTRVKRGHWQATFVPMCHDSKNTAEFELTEMYTRMLEEEISEAPEFWLWSHNRWKRTYEEWLKRLDPETGRIK